MTKYDVVTLGETMLRLTPPGLRRIEQATDVEIHVGGSESNVAIGLARLGLSVAWISRLTDNPLGHRIAGTLSRHGVDISHIVWTKEDRVGLYFLEEGRPPRGSRIFYDRANSAMSRMRPEDLPDNLFLPGKARVLHLTGITPALGVAAAATSQRILELARNVGWTISFDINYRGKLWSPDTARDHCEPFVRGADILFAPLRDIHLLYGLANSLDPENMLNQLIERYPQAVIVLTMGRDGAVARKPSGSIIHQSAFPAEEVSRLGGGDAFVAGFLYGYLATSADNTLETALRWAAATAAMKYSMLGEVPFIEYDEVANLVLGGARNELSR